MSRIWAGFKRRFNGIFRQKINQKNRQRLRQQDFSLLSSNCNGALILHDLGLRFNSPFVNLYLTPADFIRYLQRIPHYQQAELQFISTQPYPIATLDDITVHFMHYHSEDDARQKWLARSQRIDLTKLFVMMTDRDGCTYADLRAFDALPIKHKVVFTHKPYPEFSSAVCITGFEQQSQVGDLFEYVGWFGQKYYDQFDYVSWFNGSDNE